MSVAFRREGDDEHLEPKFELPLPPGPNLVTARGMAQTQTKVAELEALLPTIVDETSLAATRRVLRYWRTRLATAQLAEPSDFSHVAFGCRVTILMSGKRQTITIVGNDEADPKNGLLAFSAPLCRAIMDATLGERVPFGDRSDLIQVVEIGPAEQ